MLSALRRYLSISDAIKESVDEMESVDAKSLNDVGKTRKFITLSSLIFESKIKDGAKQNQKCCSLKTLWCVLAFLFGFVGLLQLRIEFRNICFQFTFACRRTGTTFTLIFKFLLQLPQLEIMIETEF